MRWPMPSSHTLRAATRGYVKDSPVRLRYSCFSVPGGTCCHAVSKLVSSSASNILAICFEWKHVLLRVEPESASSGNTFCFEWNQSLLRVEMKYEIIGIIVGEILQVAFTGHVLVGRKHPPRHGYMMYAISENPILLSRGLVSWRAGLLVCLWAVRLKRV